MQRLVSRTIGLPELVATSLADYEALALKLAWLQTTRIARAVAAPTSMQRFGVGDGSEHTLEEVGQSFAVTRERIRQIEAKALRKLKHPSRSDKLRSFIDSF
mgnify:CR=1 FL=1